MLVVFGLFLDSHLKSSHVSLEASKSSSILSSNEQPISQHCLPLTYMNTDASKASLHANSYASSSASSSNDVTIGFGTGENMMPMLQHELSSGNSGDHSMPLHVPSVDLEMVDTFSLQKSDNFKNINCQASVSLHASSGISVPSFLVDLAAKDGMKNSANHRPCGASLPENSAADTCLPSAGKSSILSTGKPRSIVDDLRRSLFGEDDSDSDDNELTGNAMLSY